MVLLTVLSFIVSLIVCVAIIRAGRAHAGRYGVDMPQRFHAGAVPRIGGVALACGTVSAWILSAFRDGLELAGADGFGIRTVLAWSLALLPLVAGGLAEDMTHRLSARYRLFLSVLGATLAAYLLDLSVTRLGVPGLDEWWLWMSAAGALLAVLAVAGLPHAFNLIDGYNGLAGFVAVLVCLALAHVALQVGDRQLAAMLMCLVGATAGFLVLNYPRGLIFAGDGGAYLWGGVIAIASITLVQRHDDVSPWFPMLLLIYPVWETVFSIYRKLARGVSPGVADALHFHQLIYRRIVREVFHDDEARRMLMRNNRTSPYLWGFTLLTVIPAVLFWRNTPVLMGFCLLFVCTYVPTYLMIVRFKVPRWIRRGRH
ncbi:MAG TPA: glycosyltransferase [Burkholderiaceae bacterium]|nr:glycosyltransferase [Burkholderiaceae bacterium]